MKKKWSKEPEVGDVVMWKSNDMFVLVKVHGGAKEGFDLVSLESGKDNWHVIQHRPRETTHTYKEDMVKSASTYVCGIQNLYKVLGKIHAKRK